VSFSQISWFLSFHTANSDDYEVLPGRLFQKQRSVVGRSVLNITLILYTPLLYVRNVAREEEKCIFMSVLSIEVALVNFISNFFSLYMMMIGLQRFSCF